MCALQVCSNVQGLSLIKQVLHREWLSFSPQHIFNVKEIRKFIVMLLRLSRSAFHGYTFIFFEASKVDLVAEVPFPLIVFIDSTLDSIQFNRITKALLLSMFTAIFLQSCSVNC